MASTRREPGVCVPAVESYRTVDYNLFIKSQFTQAQLTLRPDAVRIGSRNNLVLRGDEAFVVHRVAARFCRRTDSERPDWKHSTALSHSRLSISFICIP